MFDHRRLASSGSGRRYRRAAGMAAVGLLLAVLGACDDGGELADYDADREEQGGTAPDGVAPSNPFGTEPGAATGDGFTPAAPGASEPAGGASGGSSSETGAATGGADLPETPPATEPVPVPPDGVPTPAEGGGETGRANPLEGGVGGGVDTTS